MAKKLSKSALKQLLNILFLVVLVGVTLLVVFLSNRDELTWDGVKEFFRNCNPWFLVVAGALMISSVLFEALSVHLILRKLDCKPKVAGSIAYATADVYYSAITPSASGGQPASAFYMVRDGISAGTASFSLVFNLIAYTAAIIIVAGTALCIRPTFFTQIGDWYVHVLVILGFVIQGVLLFFFIACMFFGKAVLKCGNGIITFFHKIKIVKKPDKWREKLAGEVEKYKESRQGIKNHPFLFVQALLCNIGQRVSQLLISVFVCLAAAPETNFWDLCAMQAFVLIGYNAIPLPGGTGAFELLYLSVYGLQFNKDFIVTAMLMTRIFSYYARMILSGIYVLIYHAVGIRRIGKSAPAVAEGASGAEESPPEDQNTDSEENDEPDENNLS